MKHLPSVTPCVPCRKASKRRGRHRKHECTGGTTGIHVWVSCDCACMQEMIDRITRTIGWPIMALDSLEPS